jgi:hypothetical protein
MKSSRKQLTDWRAISNEGDWAANIGLKLGIRWDTNIREERRGKIVWCVTNRCWLGGCCVRFANHLATSHVSPSSLVHLFSREKASGTHANR